MNRLNFIILLVSILFLCSCQTIDVEHTPDYNVVETSSTNGTVSTNNMHSSSSDTIMELQQKLQETNNYLSQQIAQGNEDKTRIEKLEEEKRRLKEEIRRAEEEKRRAEEHNKAMKHQVNELEDALYKKGEEERRQKELQLAEEKKKQEEAQRKLEEKKQEQERKAKNSWHIRAIAYGKTEKPSKEAENVVKLFSEKKLPDVVLRKASSGNWVIDVGFFPAKNDPEAVKVQEKIWNLKYNNSKIFHDAYFVQY